MLVAEKKNTREIIGLGYSLAHYQIIFRSTNASLEKNRPREKVKKACEMLFASLSKYSNVNKIVSKFISME